MTKTEHNVQKVFQSPKCQFKIRILNLAKTLIMTSKYNFRTCCRSKSYFQVLKPVLGVIVNFRSKFQF
jgi:hypothetical protein